MSVARGAIIGLAATALAACATPDTPQVSWEYEASLEQAIAEATAADASDEQLEILHYWITIRDTPYVDLEAALLRTIQCMEDAGLVVTYQAPASGEEYPEVAYRVQAGAVAEDDVPTLMEACDVKEFRFVSMAYQLGPGVSERRAREDADYLPIAIECLSEHGIDVSAAQTLDEVNLILSEQGLLDQWACAAPPYSAA